jgi:plasmid stabilization system protein ParE
MAAYVLSAHAIVDLDTIWQYVAEESGIVAADHLEQQFQSAMMKVAEAPGMGHTSAGGQTARRAVLCGSQLLDRVQSGRVAGRDSPRRSRRAGFGDHRHPRTARLAIALYAPHLPPGFPHGQHPLDIGSDLLDPADPEVPAENVECLRTNVRPFPSGSVTGASAWAMGRISSSTVPSCSQAYS